MINCAINLTKKSLSSQLTYIVKLRFKKARMSRLLFNSRSQDLILHCGTVLTMKTGVTLRTYPMMKPGIVLRTYPVMKAGITLRGYPAVKVTCIAR